MKSKKKFGKYLEVGFSGGSVLNAMQEAQVWSLAQENHICHGVAKPMCHNYWAYALEARNCNYWAYVLQYALNTEACMP